MFLIERAIVSSGQSANAAYSSRVNPGLLLYRSRAASKGMQLLWYKYAHTVFAKKK